MEDEDNIYKYKGMKKFDTDELRAQLETFSPEQQREKDRELLNQDIGDFQKSARIVEQSVSHCREISRQFDASTDKVEKILPILQQASTVRVDENIKESIQNVAAKISGDVADAFGKKVRAVLDEVDEVSKRVSFPMGFVCVFMITMVLIIMLLVLVIYANATLVHSAALWIILVFGAGAESFALLFVWFLHHKGWV